MAPKLNGLLVIQAKESPYSEAPEFLDDLEEARRYLLFYNWCGSIKEEYVGFYSAGIVGIFLFRIDPLRPDVDEWIWVIVGDLPPAYLTGEDCPSPAAALDGYIGAMEVWVEAAFLGKSVADLIPVNVPANPNNAELLRKRLHFLDTRVLPELKSRWPERPPG